MSNAGAMSLLSVADRLMGKAAASPCSWRYRIRRSSRREVSNPNTPPCSHFFQCSRGNILPEIGGRYRGNENQTR